MKKISNKLILTTMSLLLALFIVTEFNMPFSSATETAKPLLVTDAKAKWEVTLNMNSINKAGINQASKGINQAEAKVHSFALEIISPRDAASGLPTGKRMHKPFVITKEIDKSSPLIAQAFYKNDIIPEVVLTVKNLESKETIIYTLKNSIIMDFSSVYREDESDNALEKVALVYKSIAITSIDANGIKTETIMEVK